MRYDPAFAGNTGTEGVTATCPNHAGTGDDACWWPLLDWQGKDKDDPFFEDEAFIFSTNAYITTETVLDVEGTLVPKPFWLRDLTLEYSVAASVLDDSHPQQLLNTEGEVSASSGGKGRRTFEAFA